MTASQELRTWLTQPVTWAAAVTITAVIGCWIAFGPAPDPTSVTMLQHPFTVASCRVEAVGADGAAWVRPVGGTGDLHRVMGAADC
ncbi:hypothetical protein [Mycobacterium sp. 155]|uniref:hypothetical protein n=1 Tax=Mycobacterium sp. 155 TaxID=1157943 RepID=UPI00036BC0E8|nr:hypothetical protein [Mycobacterium sp. 155]